MKERHPERKFWLLTVLVALVTLVLLSGRTLQSPSETLAGQAKTFTVVKATIPPGSPQAFSFNRTGDQLPTPPPASFVLMDTQSITYIQNGNQVTEKATLGWTLKNITCTGATTSQVNITGASGGTGAFEPGDDTVLVDVVGVEQVTCTFTNSQATPAPCDLAITKTANPNPVQSGQPVSISLTVTNVGTGPCQGATKVTDGPLPWLTVTTVAQGGTAWNCATAAPNPGATVSCTWPPPVPLGPMQKITITGNVKVPPGSKVTNCATVANPNDTNTSNNESCVDIQVPPTPTQTATATLTGTPAPANPPCTGAAGAALLNISTGTGGAGIPDPIWTVNSVPALGIQNVQISWVVPPAAKNPHWINAGNTLATNVYETRFDVPAGVASLTLAFQFAADNNVSFTLLDPQGAATQINPVLTGVVNANNFNKLHSTNPPTIVVVPLSGTTNLKPGKYSLRATVGNDPGSPTGLLVVGNVTCVSKPPTPTATATRTATATLPNRSCLVAGGLNISTGTGGVGVPDPLWTVNGGPAFGITAFISTTGFSSWAVPPAGKNPHWINADPGILQQPLPTYVYETRFDVPAGVASLAFAFEFAADNNVSFDLSGPSNFAPVLNFAGVTGNATNNFSKLHVVAYAPLAQPGPNWKPGKYTLRATVGNQEETLSGLLVAGNVRCVPKPTPTPTPCPGGCIEERVGDANGDDRVNSVDASLILQYGAGLIRDLPNLPGADVNGDGSVDSRDAALILQYDAGLLPSLSSLAGLLRSLSSFVAGIW